MPLSEGVSSVTGEIFDETNVEKENKYRYDAIITLSGAMRKHEKFGWRTTAYSEGDAFGALGGRIRVIATEYLFKKGDTAKNVLTVTGKPNYLESEPPETPEESELMKKELVGRGIPEESIFVEKVSKNTKQNFEELFRIAKENFWNHILIVTNAYHVPRSEAFCKKFQKDNPIYSDVDVDFISAEDVLIEQEPRWKELIDKAYAHPEMIKRLENEMKGLEALKSSQYSSIQEKVIK
ncbi:MAG: YdcF family protein [Patescibacteria group bacterium]|nr:YdcF family protein [Patescibacteria group bacterium]